ncbi:hypothetical protein [Streptomyces sp. LN325]
MSNSVAVTICASPVRWKAEFPFDGNYFAVDLAPAAAAPAR